MMAEDVKTGKIPNPPRKDGKSTKKFPTLKGFFNWMNFILSYFFHQLFKYRLTNYWAYESLESDNVKSLRRTLDLGISKRGTLGGLGICTKRGKIRIPRPWYQNIANNINYFFSASKLARDVLQMALSLGIGTGVKILSKTENHWRVCTVWMWRVQKPMQSLSS